MNDLLLSAIVNNRVIEFIYNDRKRVVQPHTYGRNTKGNEVLSGYQVAGDSEKNSLPEWGVFKVEKIEDLFITDNSFSARYDKGYKRGAQNRMFEEIFGEVA